VETRHKPKKEWYRVRSIDPLAIVSPYIMKNRIGSQNLLTDRIPTARVDKFIKAKQEEGMKNLSFMHVLIAAYVRAVSQRPALNRFIRGQKIYSRRDIELAITIKKEMALDSPDTVIKILFSPTDTLSDVYEKMNKAIEDYRAEQDGSFDKLAKVISFIPGLLLRATVGILRFLDYFGLLPRFLTRLSPFHASIFITSMGSLGIPPVYHHLYDFGTVPAFCAFGAKQREYKVNADGSVYKYQYVDLTFTLDERIADGYYFASALKLLRSYMRNPEQLMTPPETVIHDIP
jgi:pyruvate/2-oxoglutarate dehydrogenase complex dihydrolipoamide acyltransferase (E2) component